MKILTLCYEYPPLGGGAGRAAKSLAEELGARGHEIRFQTGGMPHLPKVERIGGVEVFRTNTFRRREEACSVVEMGLYVVASLLPTMRHVRTWRPDVIHAHLAVPSGAVACAAGWLTGVPYVITAHLGDVPGAVPEQTDHLFRFFNPFVRPIWKRAAAISVVSEFVRGLAEAAYGRPVVKIFNAVDLRGGANGALRVHEPMHLVSVGRFNRQKNFPLLVEALASLTALDWRLTIIGDGADMAPVRELVARHRLESRIALPGWCDAAQVEATLAGADLFLIPSAVEGLPVAALEALKHGLAVIGTDIGGLWDVIDDGVNGLRVASGNRVALAEKIRALLADPGTVLRMKSASREKARQFDRTTITAQYEQLLLDSAKCLPR